VWGIGGKFDQKKHGPGESTTKKKKNSRTRHHTTGSRTPRQEMRSVQNTTKQEKGGIKTPKERSYFQKYKTEGKTGSKKYVNTRGKQHPVRCGNP